MSYKGCSYCDPSPKCPHSRRGFLLFSNHTGGSPHTPTGLKGLFSLPFFSTLPSPSEKPSGLCPTWGKAGLGENPPCSAKSFPQIGGSPWGHLGMSPVKQRAGLRDAPWDQEHCPGLLGCVTPLCWCDKLIPFSFPPQIVPAQHHSSSVQLHVLHSFCSTQHGVLLAEAKAHSKIRVESRDSGDQMKPAETLPKHQYFLTDSKNEEVLAGRGEKA